MDNKLKKILNIFKSLKILIVGEGILDTYLQGSSNRLCREAPVPIVDIEKKILAPGGAANTAVNAATLGAQTTFLSVIGADEEGETLKKMLEKSNVQCAYLFQDKNRTTMVKRRISANHQLIVRFDWGSSNPINQELEEHIIYNLNYYYPQFDAIIISDYGYGILTPKIREKIRILQLKNPRVLTIDAKYLDLYKDFPASLVKPNYLEALRLLAITKEEKDKRVQQIIKYKEKILGLTKSALTAITIDSQGALVFAQNDSVYRTYAKPVEDAKAAGAGDTYSAAFTLSLASNASIQDAAEIASAAATIIVNKEGTAHCSTKELDSFFSSNSKYIEDKKNLAEISRKYKRSGKRVIFTNGCFDILHSGHISYLNQAKALGDILIVGVNTDKSVRLLKGAGRPINKLQNRTSVLSGLSSVDHIISFEEKTPTNIIKIIKPDIVVKGGDYTQDSLPETPVVQKLGGEVKILPYIPGHSTTDIIKKIHFLNRQTGAKEYDDIKNRLEQI